MLTKVCCMGNFNKFRHVCFSGHFAWSKYNRRGFEGLYTFPLGNHGVLVKETLHSRLQTNGSFRTHPISHLFFEPREANEVYQGAPASDINTM